MRCWLVVVCAVGWDAEAGAQYLIAGDLNGDGQVSVTDVQLAVVSALQGVWGEGEKESVGVGVHPGCADAAQAQYGSAYLAGWSAHTECAPPGPPMDAPHWQCADVNADGEVSVSDVVLCAQLALGLPLAVALDANGSGAPDAWEAALATFTGQAHSSGGDAASAYGGACAMPCETGLACCGGACVNVAAGDACANLDCDDQNACTTDTCVDGACVHEPIQCDDGVACTIDYCDPASGCGGWPDDRRCEEEGGVCQPLQSESSSGCVDGDPLAFCEQANLESPTGASSPMYHWCGIYPPYDGALWAPPRPGDEFECEFAIAAASSDCVDPWLSCFANWVNLSVGWTSDTELESIFVRHCMEDSPDECIEWEPPFYEAGGHMSAAPWPLASSYLTTTGTDVTSLGPGASVAMAIHQWASKSAELPDGTSIWPYVADGQVQGDPYRLTMRFRYLGEPSGGGGANAPARVCLGRMRATRFASLSSKVDTQYLEIEPLDDELFITLPKQGMVCVDESNKCSIGTLTPGQGCSFEPLACPSDGFACTTAKCNQKTGHCGQSLSKTYCYPGKCLLTSPFTDPDTGCVDPYWQQICWMGDELCDGADVFHWPGEYGPPEGEYVRCPLLVARGQEVCEHWTYLEWGSLKHCAPYYFEVDVATDTERLRMVGAFSEQCWPGAGCFTVPLWDGTANSLPLSSGHSLIVTAPGPEHFNFTSHTNFWAFFIGPHTLLNDAYLAEDGVTVMGDPHVFDLWFQYADGHDASEPVPICYHGVSFPPGEPHWARNEDGVFIYPAPPPPSP